MFDPLKHPFFILVVVLLIAFWLAAWTGDSLRAKQQDQDEESRRDFLFIIGGTLTLLGLLIGFPSPWRSRGMDGPKEEHGAQEANAIGTEYIQADLLITTPWLLLEFSVDEKSRLTTSVSLT